MSLKRLVVALLGIAAGSVVMVTLIVPLNLALLRAVAGGSRPRGQVEARPKADFDGVIRQFRAGGPGALRGAPEGLKLLLSDLADAMRARDLERIAGHFHAPRTLRELREARVVPGLNGPQQDELEAAVRANLSRALASNAELPWDQPGDFHSVKVLAGGNEGVVVGGYHDWKGPRRVRWWFTREGGDWRLYDFEYLDTGIRVSRLLPSLLANPPAPLPDWAMAPPWPLEAAAHLRSGNAAEAEKVLARVEKAPLSPPYAAARWVLTGAARVQRGNFYGALPCLEEARRLNPDMPHLDLLLAQVQVRLGRPRQALDHLDRYRALAGDDARVWACAGSALAQRGQAQKAAEALRKALAEEPTLTEALQDLRRLLPAGKGAELAERFTRLAEALDPDARLERFDRLAFAALADRDTEAVEAYVGVLRGQNVVDVQVDLCLARARALAGKSAEAVALFKDVMNNVPDAQQRRQCLRELLLDLAEGSDFLSAYRLAPDRREAFPVLADELFQRQDDEALRALLDAHRQEHKGDAWAHFYEGELHAQAKRPDEAERAFAAAQAAAPDEATRDHFRARRVWARFDAAGWGAAYKDVGPRRATFHQLAQELSARRDREQLAALVKAHRALEPADPNLPLWEIEAAWLGQDWGTAVRLLRQHRDGAFAGPGQRPRFWYRLLRGLARLGKLDEVRKEAQALVRLDRGNLGELGFLVGDLVRERETEAVAALAAALRQTAPDAPEGPLWQARAEVLRGRVAQAGERLRLALDRQPDALRQQQYVAGFLHDTVAARKALEGYRAAPDPDRAFRVLADDLLGRLLAFAPPEDAFPGGSPDPDDDFPEDRFPGDDFPDPDSPGGRIPEAEVKAALRKLLQAHTAARPRDPAPHLYAGELHRLERQYARAEEAFARGMALKPEEELRRRFSYPRVMALYKLGKGVWAYTELGRDPQTFEQLAHRFNRDRNAKGLEALIAAHRQTDPEDPRLVIWETEARFVAGDYAAALRLLAQHRRGAFAQPAHQWTYQDRLVRSLARLKRFDEALAQASAFAKKKHGNLLLPAVVHALAGDVARTEAALQACARRFYRPEALYADPDLGLALSGEAFRAVRQRFPERMPWPRSPRKE
jgi:tetratricopeptide (TPR) repeat protein